MTRIPVFDWWRNLPIARKLYSVVGLMAVLIACELLTLSFAMGTLSSVRAFVGGESLWSKAQKNAAIRLERYSSTADEREYAAFLEELRIPEGDHRARLELMKPRPDLAVARQGFLDGQIHPDDIDGVIRLLRRFYWVSYLSRAVGIWSHGDELLAQFKSSGEELHRLLNMRQPIPSRVRFTMDQINALNSELTKLQAEFSDVLGAGSRWLEHVILSLLFLAVLTVECIGLTLTFRTGRSISRGLSELGDAADRIGRGDFGRDLAVCSGDEIGRLTESVNRMRTLLEKSHRDFEMRLRERTSELAAVAEANAKLYKEAEQAVQARDEFISIASHELKTPLTGLHLQLQLLAHTSHLLPAGKDSERMQKLTDNSLRLNRRLIQLIEELLDLTRLRLGRLELKRQRCDLAAIVRESVTQLGGEAAHAGSMITLHAHHPVLGEFDPTRLSQIATNLVSNAIKYGNGKPIDVHVDARGNGALLEVRDQGLGIASDRIGNIFERFERATEDEKIAGLGLGLYITRQIIEAHGGKIAVASRMNEGSTFTVELPLA